MVFWLAENIQTFSRLPSWCTAYMLLAPRRLLHSQVKIRRVACRLPLTSSWPERCTEPPLTPRNAWKLFFILFQILYVLIWKGEVQWTSLYGCEDPMSECQDSISLSTGNMGYAQDKLSEAGTPKEPKGAVTFRWDTHVIAKLLKNNVDISFFYFNKIKF